MGLILTTHCVHHAQEGVIMKVELYAKLLAGITKPKKYCHSDNGTVTYCKLPPEGSEEEFFMLARSLFPVDSFPQYYARKQKKSDNLENEL